MGPPQRFVGVDVADSGDRALRQQLGLDACRAEAHGPPQLVGVNASSNGSGPWAASVGNETWSPVVTTAMRPKRRTSRYSSVAPSSNVHVGANVRVGPTRGGDAEHAGHAEVNDELVVVVEIEQQVLAPTPMPANGGAHGEDGGGELRGLVGGRCDDAASLDAGPELAADGLDLGQLGHGATVASLLVNDRFDEVLDEAAILARPRRGTCRGLGVGLLAEWVDIDDLLVRLGGRDRPRRSRWRRRARRCVPEAGPVAVALSAAAGVTEPAVGRRGAGTAVALLAWEIVDPFSGNVSLVVEFEHADLVRHSMLVEIEDEVGGRHQLRPAGPGR